MNGKKIAFITCVNDETKYEECSYYLGRLRVPEGYSVDRISIRDASSMASGYNAGMKDSDAKYKVYLHQDVYIKNVDFISDMLGIFKSSDQIGMLGMIGKKEMGTSALCMMDWDTGKVIYDFDVMSWEFSEKGAFTEVVMADGLLLATQQDIPWREDVFDGWDFYDASQCMEFIKAGYKIVVPNQKEIWCCHDGICANLIQYFDYYERFVSEYGGMEGVPESVGREEKMLYEAKVDFVKEMDCLNESIEELMHQGEKEKLRAFFQDPEVRKIYSLREYKSIVCIDWEEERHHSSVRFWDSGASVPQLIRKLRKLKCALKRMEYDAEDPKDAGIREGEYSKYAVMEIWDQYTVYKDKIYDKLRIYVKEKGNV